jgi:hypothetical protein
MLLIQNYLSWIRIKVLKSLQVHKNTGFVIVNILNINLFLLNPFVPVFYDSFWVIFYFYFLGCCWVAADCESLLWQGQACCRRWHVQWRVSFYILLFTSLKLEKTWCFYHISLASFYRKSIITTIFNCSQRYLLKSSGKTVLSCL